LELDQKVRRILPATMALLLVWIAGARAQDQDSLALGRRFTQLFYAGQFEQLWEQMSDGQHGEHGSIENLAKFRSTVRELVGEEVEVLSEQIDGAEGQEVYVRQVKYEKSAELFDLKWTISSQGKITDFSIRPSQPATGFEYRTKTRLRLPFDGDWYVGSGGRKPEQNANHYYDYKTRFDIDFVRVEDVRFDQNAPPPRNEDFAAFGQPILAPGSGAIAVVRDGIPDNLPGQINEKAQERVGNFVVIDHGNGEYSLLAHLKNGSVKVQVGDKVAVGQKVGECGNSGNSSGPHLHYGLRGAPSPDKSMSLPAQFLSYFADGKPVPRGEPVQGQKVKARGGVRQ
jgi:murein DD-endopeptidase MepM/ murein hydrolase activator NlpD